MAGETLGEVIRRLGRFAGLQGDLTQTDAQLLDRFARRRDEPAFAALMARHGPMVLGLCRRLLSDPRDAEDAFQAVFLILARKAGAVQRQALLSSWLYGVAWRVALPLRGQASRRRQREQSGVDFDSLPADDAAWSDARWVVHEEVQRLPDVYRSAVILCCLEGKTNEEAALLLRRPVGTVKSRLTRARELLRARLTRRGMALSGGALAAVLAVRPAPAPAALLDATIHAATRFAVGEAAAGGLASARAVALTQGILRTMMLTKLKIAAALALAVALLGGGGGLAYRSWAAVPGDGPRAAAPAADKPRGKTPGEDPEKPKLDKPDEDAEKFSHLPKDAQALLEQAEQLEIYSLEPGPQDEEPKDAFHGFKVLGKTTVKEAAARKKLVDLIEKGIAENEGVAGCFNPRHGIRAAHDGKSVDLVICFECFGMQVFNGGDKAFVWTNAEPQEALDKVLREAGVPLAAKPHEKSDREALPGLWRVEAVMIGGKDATGEWPKNMQEWAVKPAGELADAAVECRTIGDPWKAGASFWLKLGLDETPKDIDFTLMTLGEPLPNRGVYRLEGDVWKLCLPRGTKLMADRPKAQDRPKGLASTEANGAILITLKRVKTDQDRPTGDKPPKDDAPSYEFLPGKCKESLEVRVEGGRTVYVIAPGGPGLSSDVTIRLKTGEWPRDVTLRLSKFHPVDTLSVTTDHHEWAGSQGFTGKMTFAFRNAKGDFEDDPSGRKLDGVVEATKEGLDIRLPPNLLVGSRKVEIFWMIIGGK